MSTNDLSRWKQYGGYIPKLNPPTPTKPKNSNHIAKIKGETNDE